MATAPHRAWPTFMTALAGPLVNVGVCVAAGIGLYFLAGGVVPLNPFHLTPPAEFYLTNPAFYLWWVFSVSYVLLLFNLLPIYPLDGGQMLQAALWPGMGYYRSIVFACRTGLVGGSVLMVWGLFSGQWLLLFVAVSGVIYCYQRLAMAKELGPECIEELEGADASCHHEESRPRRRHLSRRALRRMQRLAAREQAEQARIDEILDKVSAHGLPSLTWRERRCLRKATERQRQRDVEVREPKLT